ncbi:MAG: carbohydrate kinase family protein [Candidatus Diapherotrites archaeon]|nr:carbohydrate kinase family protein [Candidatus Diapherotrites archaeon]
MIYSIGHIALDYVFSLKEFPPNHSSRPIEDFSVRFGGGAANHAYTCAKLGAKVSLVSAAGSDFPGSDYEKHLRRVGIELKHVKVFRKDIMPRAYIFNDKNMHQRTMFYWGASRFFKNMPIPKLKKKAIKHIAAADPSFNKRLASKYFNISFDPARDLVAYSGGDLKHILSSTKFLYCNKHELREIVRKTRIRANELADYVIVSHGAKGSMILHRTHRIRIRPYTPKSVVDPTGAGDAYMAGFLTAFEKGYDIETCGNIASCVASFVVEKQGPQDGVPTWNKMKRRLTHEQSRNR